MIHLLCPDGQADRFFAAVRSRLRRSAALELGTFQTPDDVLAYARQRKGVITHLDLVGHGSPGLFGLEGAPHFDCYRQSCSLTGIAALLAPGATLRFLGCEVAFAPNRAGGYSFDPTRGLTWLKTFLAPPKVRKRFRVAATRGWVFPHHFGPDGYLGGPSATLTV